MVRPVAAALIAYIFGILAGYFWHPPVIFLICLGIVDILWGFYDEVRSWRKTGWYIYLGFMLLGVLTCILQIDSNKGNIALLAGRPIECVGTVVEEPDVRADATKYVVRVESVVLRDQRSPGLGGATPKGCLLVSVRGSESQFSYGDLLKILAIPELPEEPGNPGEFNYRKYLAAKGIQLTVNSRGNTGVKRIGTGHVNPVTDLCIRFKQVLLRVISSTMTPKHYGLMAGILFGTCGLIDPGYRNDFAFSGVVHILSVSGYHVALIMSFCLSAASIFKLNRRVGDILAILITALYTVMSGAGPPAVRAMIMAWVLLAARSLKRDYDWVSSLSLSALLILVFNPLALFDAGFQLSFLATWGILYLAPFLQKWVCAALRALLLRLSISGASASYGERLPGTTIRKMLGNGTVITLAAQLAVLPVTSYYFNYISLVSLPANLIIVPLISLIMLLGGLAALMGLIWMPLAAIINVSTGLILDCVVGLAHFFAGLPFAVCNVKQPGILSMAVFYLFIMFMTVIFDNPAVNLRIRRLWIMQRQALIFLSMSLAAVILWLSILFPEEAKLQITFLDIGQGDAALIECPGGPDILLDTGGAQAFGASTYNPGEKILLPFLRRQGIDEIDALLLSHAHSDHIQGAEAIAKGNIPVKLLLVDKQFCDSKEGAQLVNTFQANGSQIREIAGGDTVTLGEDITMETLSPMGNDSGSANDDSLVVRLCYKNFHVLFTGDAEEPALKELDRRFPGVHADVFKVSHHGSRNGWWPEFYRSVAPRLAVISVGPNYFGHPSQEVLQGLRELGIPFYRTDQDGAVKFISDGLGFRVETQKSKQEKYFRLAD